MVGSDTLFALLCVGYWEQTIGALTSSQSFYSIPHVKVFNLSALGSFSADWSSGSPLQFKNLS